MLLNLIKHQQPYIGKIYIYVKDPSELKYQLLIDRKERLGIKQTKKPKAFIYYLQLTMFMETG